MVKATLLTVFFAMATNVLGADDGFLLDARIARSPGGAGWQGSGSGYGGPSVVAARSGRGGGAWSSGNLVRSGGSRSGWGGSGLNGRSGGYSTSGWGGSSHDVFSGKSSGCSGFAARSAGGYGAARYGGYRGNFGSYSGNAARYGGYPSNSGGHSAGGSWDSSDYSDPSGRSVSWQASW